MPIFQVETNVSADKVPSTFQADLTKAMATTLGRPEQSVCIVLKTDISVTFGGKKELAALCKLFSTMGLGVEENRQHTKCLMKVVCDGLGISEDRVYILFRSMAPEDIGYKMETIKKLRNL